MVQMRTDAERIEQLHLRAAELRRQRNRKQLTVFGSASIFLTAVLLAVVHQMLGLSVSITGDPYTGSSLLSESAGGYVLAAVIAFIVGVVITAVIFRYRNRGK